MQAFDASSIIYAWDNYPIKQFPGMWSWIGKQILTGEIVMLTVAIDETGDNSPDCRKWIEKHGIEVIPVTNDTIQIALRIKELLGIINDKYGSGVGENDIFIIASAKEYGHELVSNENRQNNLLHNMKKYKIPAVCGMLQVDVPCVNFLEVIKRSKVVFR